MLRFLCIWLRIVGFQYDKKKLVDLTDIHKERLQICQQTCYFYLWRLSVITANVSDCNKQLCLCLILKSCIRLTLKKVHDYHFNLSR